MISIFHYRHISESELVVKVIGIPVWVVNRKISGARTIKLCGVVIYRKEVL